MYHSAIAYVSEWNTWDVTVRASTLESFATDCTCPQHALSHFRTCQHTSARAAHKRTCRT
eukprot:684213-Rhodomonas_salina.4